MKQLPWPEPIEGVTLIPTKTRQRKTCARCRQEVMYTKVIVNNSLATWAWKADPHCERCGESRAFEGGMWTDELHVPHGAACPKAQAEKHSPSRQKTLF